MKQLERLVSLLIVLSFALLIACVIGCEESIPWKKTLNCPLYSIFKQGLITFQFLLSQSPERAYNTLQILLERAQNVLFSQTNG